MDLVRLINHPELMSKETLYELRNIVALYPYYQTARILMLKNMYLLHDSAFDDELRRTALYVTDRSMLFQLVESAHYEFKNPSEEATNKIETTTTALYLLSTTSSTLPQNRNWNLKVNQNASQRLQMLL